MDCCTPDYDSVFSEKRAKADLKRYRKAGPDKSTRLLIEALRSLGVRGKSLLDIGAGIGVIDHELLDAGVGSAVHVDASAASASAAQQESERRGTRDRIQFRRGDFVAIADAVEPADVVTLDRVICCYANMEQLVVKSASHARELYGIVIPRERAITRLGRFGVNTVFRVTRNPFRFHIHPIRDIERVLGVAGFRVQSVAQTIFWRVAVYARPGTGA
jgi:2-polyprenyl-3-methyl-5-hydroxy-6-metoxy-1,4-benzoquinol methylase